MAHLQQMLLGVTRSERLPSLTAVTAAAAFVADIYGTAVKQGPSLPAANRSVLMSEFRTNSTKFRTRVLTSLAQVSRQRLASPQMCFTAHLLLLFEYILPAMPGGYQGTVQLTSH